jgi:GTP-binding protein
MVDLPSSQRFVVADLPGLIAGAHEGRGLGDRFLRHVERTRLLLHLVDVSPVDGSDPVEAWRTVRRELEAYGHGLADRPEIVAATKVDTLPEGPEREAVLRRLARAVDRDLHPISAVSGAGLKALLAAVGRALRDQGASGCSTTSSSTSR